MLKKTYRIGQNSTLGSNGGTCVSAVCWACRPLSLQYTQTHIKLHRAVTNWLIEPLSHPFPMCAVCLFNSCGRLQSWDKAVFIPFLFISRGKYTKAANSSVFTRKSDGKVHPQTPKAVPHNCCLWSRADENKFESRGRRSVQLRMPLWHVSAH